MNHIVIMAGGVGSRFWPMSTPEYPKQFVDVLGTGKTMIQMTVERFAPLCPVENFWVVTSGDYVPIVKEQLPYLPEANILAEPAMRNTAPCIAYACWKIRQKDPYANVVVTPADALVLDTKEFHKVIGKDNSFASEANVSVAYSTDKAGELNFRNACALLAFRFETEEDARKTASVTIRAKTDTEGVYHGITGNVKVNVQQSEAGFMPVVEGEGTADHVTVYAPSGGFKYNSENPVTYYAVICPGVYDHGFEIIVTSGYSEGSDIADFPVAMDRVSGPLERNTLFSMGALANPFDILPEEIVISLDFANEENLNPLGTFPIMAQQSADGDDYTYKYTYEHEGKTFTEPLTFTIYKGSGYSYTYLNGAATGTDKYFYVLNSGANTCMKFPAIRGRYLKSVSFSHTGTTYNRNFRLQEGYPTAGHYYTVGAVPEAADAVGTAAVTFPTGVEDTAQLNVTKAGVPYFVQFTSASKYSITNITLVYTKDEPFCP